LLNHNLHTKKELIEGKILFLKTVINTEKKQVIKFLNDFEKFKKKLDKKYKGNDVLEKSQSEAGSMAKLNSETHNLFFGILNWSWHILEEIESKLAEIKI